MHLFAPPWRGTAPTKIDRINAHLNRNNAHEVKEDKKLRRARKSPEHVFFGSEKLWRDSICDEIAIRYGKIVV